MSFRNQFALPTGVGGRLAGWIMSTKGDNVARNRWVVEGLDLDPGQRLLEVGCGPGVAIEAAASRGAEVVAVDPSPVMRSMAGRRNRRAVAEGRVRILDGDAADLPDGPFDAVLTVNTVQFWADLDATLAALRHRLVPGGRIAIALQPRFEGATDADARQLADRHANHLAAAGFVAPTVDLLDLRPVACGRAMATAP